MMDDTKEIANSFSNAAYEESQISSSLDIKSTDNRKTVLVIGVLFIIACSIGAGIGVGYAIGEEKGSNNGGGGVVEPIVDPTKAATEPAKTEIPPTPDLPEDWVDMPCRDGGPRCPAGISTPPVLLVSLDGFRSDYLSRGLTPVLSRMAECGVSAPHMIPTFPTITFPNHYTIATGLYPESHGIIGNTIYDATGAKFSLGSAESLNRKWWGGEPIWNTARWQGKRSATFFWPGSEVDIQGIRPNYYNKYDEDISYIQRIDTVLGWLALPDGYRPDVVTLYFDEPDHTGHDPGPDSEEENEILKRMDGMIRRLMDGLMNMDMLDCVNMIVIADHGMANRSCDLKFTLNDYVSSSGYRIVTTGGTMLRLHPESDAEIADPEELVEELLCKHEVAVPYLKEDLPKRWHYAFNDKIEPVEVTVPEQWTASGGASSWCNGGTHGYDNLGNLMKAMFLALGPGFKSQIEIQPFQNIELYNVMCELMDVEPAPNNGTLGSLHHMMRSPKPLPDNKPTPAPDMECPFPTTDDDYNNRLADDTSGCLCNATDVTMYDKQLDLSSSEVESAMMKHAPLGAPVVTFDTEYCHLTQHDYVTAFSHDLRTPLWTSFTLTRPQSLNHGVGAVECSVRPDVRVENEYAPRCSDYANMNNPSNLLIGYLYSPSFSESMDRAMDAMISSNTVPQFEGFARDVWDGFLVPHLARWANMSSEINVVVGPVFDFNFNGLRDNNDTIEKDGTTFGDSPTILPTHYFMVVSRCKAGARLDLACSEFETAAFLLKNADGIKTCQSEAEYVEHHVASIRDIERLTGLELFPDVMLYDAIHMKIHAPNKGELWTKWPLY